MFLDSIHEECGVFGIYESKTANVAKSTYTRSSIGDRKAAALR